MIINIEVDLVGYDLGNTYKFWVCYSRIMLGLNSDAQQCNLERRVGLGD
jgi:hypothetical protein